MQNASFKLILFDWPDILQSIERDSRVSTKYSLAGLLAGENDVKAYEMAV